ncbi:MAG: agmatinase [Chloroflexota bacterium]
MAEDRLNLPFVGIPTFLRAPIENDLSKLDADIAVLGVPSDEGSPWKPGARFAPRSMREMSVRYAGYGAQTRNAGFWDIDERKRYLAHEMGNRRIVDCGDVDILYTNPRGTFDNITAAVRTILDRGALPLVLGGDHAITYPVVRAYKEDLYVVHFDAHLDFRPFVHGIEWANGMPMRLVSQLSNVKQIIQVGIRSLRTSESDVADAEAHGNDVITVEEYRQRGIEGVLEKLPSGGKTYVSIDIDALDLPLVPGCSSSEVNGLTYDELRKTLFAIAKRTEVVGFDVVEINPMLDVPSGNTSLIGAQIALEFLGRVVENPEYLRRRGRA